MSSLWEFASARGMDRRHFLRLLLAGGATAVLAACGDMGSPDAPMSTQAPVAETGPAQAGPWFKDPAAFIVHGDKGLEARLENMQGMLTPNRLFFVRNNSVSPNPPIGTGWVERWGLRAGGQGGLVIFSDGDVRRTRLAVWKGLPRRSEADIGRL